MPDGTTPARLPPACPGPGLSLPSRQVPYSEGLSATEGNVPAAGCGPPTSPMVCPEGIGVHLWWQEALFDPTKDFALGDNVSPLFPALPPRKKTDSRRTEPGNLPLRKHFRGHVGLAIQRRRALISALTV
jgi:hypothetical protein